MKKRLIFDLDNTLIIWKESYINPLKETMKEYKVNTDYRKINRIIDDLNEYKGIISKELLLNNINKECSLNLDIEFVDTLLKKQESLGEPNEEVIEVLKYLKEKYNMVILTNYFKQVQEKRLKKAGIRDFFEEIYASDCYPQKPDKKAFEVAIGNYNILDCTMIGDNLESDIIPAEELGLNVIICDYFNKIKDDSNQRPIVRKIKDLKKYL